MAALLLLTLVLSSYGDDLSDLYKQGVDLYGQKKYSEAIAVLERAVQSGDAHSAAGVDATYLLGNAYLQTHDIEKAEITFAHLYSLPPESAAAHLLTAELMLKREYKEEAAAQVRQALALDSKMPGAHFTMGEIAALRGSLDDGAAEFSDEIEINPNLAMAWYRLGEILTRQEKWPAAIANLERAIWLNADFIGPYILLGKCYLKIADYGNAEGVLRHALTLDPNNRAASDLLKQTLSHR